MPAVTRREGQVVVQADARLQAVSQSDALAGPSQTCGNFARAERTRRIEREGARAHEPEDGVAARQEVRADTQFERGYRGDAPARPCSGAAMRWHGHAVVR